MSKLPVRTKIIFGSADLFGGGALNLVGFYYLIFLTDVMQIRPAVAGGIMLISKLWDAVSDPLMGLITDRTRSRLGRRRPWFIAAIFTVFLAVALLWFPANPESEGARIAWATFAYLFFSTVSTTVMVPYLSMQPLLTDDYQERTSLNAFKMAFSFIAAIIAATLPMAIVASFDDLRRGWMTMGLIFALIYALPWIGLALHIKEQDNRNDPPPPPFRLADFIAPLRIRCFRILIGIYLGTFLAMDIQSTVIAYWVTYVFGRPEELSTILGALVFSQIVFLPVLVRLSRKSDKNRILTWCALLWLVAVSVIAFLPASVPLPLLVLIAVLAGFGLGGSVVLPWTMYPDTTDVGRLVSGRDNAGAFSGLMTFFRKAASALALFLVGFVLEFAGYIKPLQQQVDGVTRNINQTQPESALLAIRLVLCLMPLLLLLMVMILSRRYPLTREIHARLSDYLAGRKASGPRKTASPPRTGNEGFSAVPADAVEAADTSAAAERDELIGILV